MLLQVNIPDLSKVLDVLTGQGVLVAARESVTESTSLLLNRIRRRFLDQVDSEGKAWEPSFAAFERSFEGRGGGTLFDTGTLFNSIQLYSVSPLEGAIATDVPYAAYHNFGIGQEVREFMGVGVEDESLVLRVFLKKITEALE